MAVVEVEGFAHHKIFSFEIASGQTISDVLDIREFKLGALQMATMTSITLDIQGSFDRAGPFVDVFDDAGTQAQITIASDRIVSIDKFAGSFAQLRFVRFVGNAAELAARTLHLFLKE